MGRVFFWIIAAALVAAGAWLIFNMQAGVGA